MKITTDLLRKWEACTDGYGWFIRKFPQGAEYTDVQQALRDDNRFDNSGWLTERAFSELLDDTSVAKDIAADAKNASDKLIEATTAISVEVATVDVITENDNGTDGAQIGSSGHYARIGSSGNDAQIGSSGNGARIVADGENAVIAVAGFNTQFRIGKGASISIAYRDANERARFAVGYEGENLKAGIWYRVTKAGQFEEVETGELADAA